LVFSFTNGKLFILTQMTEINLEQKEVLKAVFFILLAFISMFLVLVLFFYFSRKKIVQIEVEKKNIEIDNQKKILQNTIATQEEERKRIAQDLHDDISSKLNIVSLNTHLLRTPNLKDEELHDITQNIIELTKKALDNSRRIAHDLLPPVLEKFGLHAGIEELVFECNSSKSVTVEYLNSATKESLESLSAGNQLHIFRILQELINNSLKHGNAKKITISLENFSNQIKLLYHDDGLGFTTNDTKVKSGIGMSNIASRVTIINGVSEIFSQPNEGFQFQLIFAYE
jgi:two-component system, NarL family, sensor kinase